MSLIYRESDEYHPLKPLRLKSNIQYNMKDQRATRTIHNHLDVLDKTIHDFQCLCRSRSSLLLRQSVQSL